MTPDTDPEHNVWRGAGVPRSGFWTDERVKKADELVSDLLKTDFDRVVRDGLDAGRCTKIRPAASDIPLIAVTNEGAEVPAVKYDRRRLTPFSTEKAIQRARGEEP